MYLQQNLVQFHRFFFTILTFSWTVCCGWILTNHLARGLRGWPCFRGWREIARNPISGHFCISEILRNSKLWNRIFPGKYTSVYGTWNCNQTTLIENFPLSMRRNILILCASKIEMVISLISIHYFSSLKKEIASIQGFFQGLQIVPTNFLMLPLCYFLIHKWAAVCHFYTHPLWLLCNIKRHPSNEALFYWLTSELGQFLLDWNNLESVPSSCAQIRFKTLIMTVIISPVLIRIHQVWITW